MFFFRLFRIPLNHHEISESGRKKAREPGFGIASAPVKIEELIQSSADFSLQARLHSCMQPGGSSRSLFQTPPPTTSIIDHLYHRGITSEFLVTHQSLAGHRSHSGACGGTPGFLVAQNT